MSRNWSAYNNQLVKRGEIYFSMDFLDSWERELASMNRGKRGRRWAVEGYFSSVKRQFGESVRATSAEGMAREAMWKSLA